MVGFHIDMTDYIIKIKRPEPITNVYLIVPRMWYRSMSALKLRGSHRFIPVHRTGTGQVDAGAWAPLSPIACVVHRL